MATSNTFELNKNNRNKTKQMSPLKLFISYSHQDEKYKDQLTTHLTVLKRRGIVKEWHDRKLVAGAEWDKSIKQELLDSDIILLLISADFLASNYCYDIEIKKAMERHEQGEAKVIPIIVRPCDWKDLPFSKIQGLPKDAKALSTWTDIDEGYLNIIEGIKTSINSSEASPSSADITETEENDFISFPYEVIIGRLPRGYVVIQDIEFGDYAHWAITAYYFNYDGKSIHGTHYHESYRRRWESPEGQEAQCAKLSIQKADWNIADTALYLIIELRGRSKDDTIESILENFQSEYEFYEYYKKDEKIPKPTIPDKFIHLNKTGEIRDIIEELRIDSWKNYDLKTLHTDFESNRRSAYLLLYDKLKQDHPALAFVKEIIDSYDESFDIEKLRDCVSS
jgi:hypothetical protein